MSRGAPPDPLPDDGIYFTDTEDGRGEKWPFRGCLRCTASSKQRTRAARAEGLIGDDELRRCRRPVSPGKSVCRYHGTHKLARQKNGRPISTGKYSERMGRFRKHYEEALASGSNVDLREGLAVFDAIVKRTMERVNERDTPDFRENARKLCAEAMNASGEEEKDKKLKAMMKYLDRGCSEDASIRLLASSVEAMQKRVEKAWEIKLKAEDVMNVRDLVTVISQFTDAVYRVAGDKIGDLVISEIDSMIREFGTVGPAVHALED